MTNVANGMLARSSGPKTANHIRTGIAAATASNVVRHRGDNRSLNARPPSTNAGRKATIPCGAATMGKANSAANRQTDRRPQARAPLTRPRPKPARAAKVMMPKVPDQLNPGSVEISRIQTRAATPQPAPMTSPAAAWRHITRPRGDRPTWRRPLRWPHASGRGGSRSTECLRWGRTGPMPRPRPDPPW